jgi:hypothetical protein
MGDATMTPLERMQIWYLNQCNEDWEHDAGISISSIDNPGWSMRINLRGTYLEGRPFTRIERAGGENDWLHAWGTGEEYHVACGPRNLDEALSLFCDWADS